MSPDLQLCYEQLGFEESPFRITPDTDYFFPSQHHQEALDHLRFGIASGGLTMLTGEVGVGKTLLCRYLLRHPPGEIETLFRRSFTLEGIPAAATLRLRAFRRATVALNGRTVALRHEDPSWKAERSVDVARYLVAGENELSVRVSNAEGPPALWLTLRAEDDLLVTDRGWQASLAGAAWRPAAPARAAVRGRVFDPDGTAERSLASLGLQWPRLTFHAALALATFLGLRSLRRRLPEHGPWRKRLTALVVPSAALLLAALLIHNSGLLRRGIGFDWSRPPTRRRLCCPARRPRALPLRRRRCEPVRLAYGTSSRNPSRRSSDGRKRRQPLSRGSTGSRPSYPTTASCRSACLWAPGPAL